MTPRLWEAVIFVWSEFVVKDLWWCWLCLVFVLIFAGCAASVPVVELQGRDGVCRMVCAEDFCLDV